MTFVEYAKRRYDAAIREIERLKQLEFPYAQIRAALLEIEQVFRGQRTFLDKLSPKSTPAVAKNACSLSLTHLFNYTPFLGVYSAGDERAQCVRDLCAFITPGAAAPGKRHQAAAVLGMGLLTVRVSSDERPAGFRSHRHTRFRVGKPAPHLTGGPERRHIRQSAIG